MAENRRGRLRARLQNGGRTAVATLLLAGLAAAVMGEHTRRWRLSTYEEFLKGSAKGVAVRSDGRLELAPRFAHLADADASYLWSIKLDAKGAVYAAGGTPAKVFRVEASGKPATVFESMELSAQAMAFDAKGVLYVGTSPDGKVYRVSASGEKSVFFEPKTKYIWDLAFGADGMLYVATGDKGQIFGVTPDGKGSVFYASDEAHIKVLALDGRGNLIAGTEPSGRVLRVTDKKGEAEGFVLYETAKREVTSLAVTADGVIYAAAIGDKQRGPGPVSPAVVSPPPAATATGGNITIGGGGPVQGGAPFVAFPPQMSSSIYRIGVDGAPEELWSSREDLVYALGIGPDGRLLAGTGNNGALLVVDGRGVFAQLAKAGSAQITGITKNASGKIFLCTANPGKVFSSGPEYEAEGVYEAKPFDAQLFSQWGRLEWWGPPPPPGTNAKTSGPRAEFFVRTGNTEDPGKEWSRWFGPYTKPGSVEAPGARFAQWKAVIHGGAPGDGLDWVSLAYLPKNVAPVIDGIALQEPGVRAQNLVVVQPGQQQSVALRMPPIPSPNGVIVAQSSGVPPRFEAPPQAFAQKGYATVLWSAHDENDDELRFAVYYRGENESAWKLLKDNLEQRFYSWDTSGMPDGAYYLKIVASDAPSNPAETALEISRESERFEIDNTPPVIEKLEAYSVVTRGGQSPEFRSLLIKFGAHDNSSNIERAQYSLDGGDWVLVAPKGGISDGLTESYEFSVNAPGPGEHTIAVRAYDHFDNVGSAKTKIVVPGNR